MEIADGTSVSRETLARSRSASTREEGEKRDRLWIDVLYRSIGNLVTLSLGASSASKFVPRHFANASPARARASLSFPACLKGLSHVPEALMDDESRPDDDSCSKIAPRYAILSPSCYSGTYMAPAATAPYSA